MSRPATVTLDEVRAAIEALKAQGVPDPGVHRIRALIGHGSVTTINKLKHQIHTEDLNRLLPGTTTPMPDPITEAAANLWEALNAEIDRIDSQREDEVQEGMEKLTAEHQRVLGEKDKLSDQIEHLEMKQAEDAEQIAALTAQHGQAIAERDAARNENQILKERIVGIEKERDHTIEQMSTLSQHAAEREKALAQQVEASKKERLAERAQAEAERKRLEEDVQHWRGQFTQQNTFLSDQIKAREEEIRTIRAQVEDLQQQLRKQHEEHETLRAQLAEQREARIRAEQALEDQAQQLKQIPALRDQMARLSQERDSFDASLRQCREELSAARALIEHLERKDAGES